MARPNLQTACLTGVLLLAAAVRLWRLEDNGFGTTYYAAGVASQLQSLRLFFYNSFDPAGFVSLDKPPLAMWIQVAFAWMLGFSGWTLHLPQVLAGTGSVALLHRLVLRPFGPAAATIAALVLALMPVAVAVDRSNNTDAWLVFFLLLAATLALRGRGLSLVAAMAVLGLAFNVKMLAALICGPALLGGWLLAGSLDWRRRLGWTAVAGVVLATVSLAWAVVFDLTPEEQRPYAGSTAGNSMLELIVVHNGLERFVRNRPPPAVVAPAPPQQRYRLFDAVPVGPLRLAHPTLASQFAWLLPIAIAGLVLLRPRDRTPATLASLALWGLWLATYGLVFSLAGGIFHAYYLSALAPPIAALAGIGCVRLWRRGAAWLGGGLAITALWQAYIAGASLGWLSVWMLVPLLALALAALAIVRDKRPATILGGAALLVLPLAWTLSTVFSPANLTLPSASLPRWLGLDDGRGPILSRRLVAATDDPKLIAFLADHRGGARYLAATPTAPLAAPLIIRTGQPVMAVGGFSGRDPILSLDAFAEAIKRGDVRYVLLADQRRPSPFSQWTRAHGRAVDEREWRSPSVDDQRPLELYELKAEANR